MVSGRRSTRDPVTERVKSTARLLWRVLEEFVGDGCPRMAAALSYYSIFALPPLIGLLALVTSRFVRPGDIRDVISRQVQAIVGVQSATEIVDVIEGVVRPEITGPAAVLGILALVFAATGAFAQLQAALNAAWGVQHDPRRGEVRVFLVKRAVSILMIGVFAFLLLLSLVASTFISYVRGVLAGITPWWASGWGLPVTELAISLLAIVSLFTIILRYVPDAVVKWRDAIVGGLFTGGLFTVGKVLIGFHLARSDPGSVYGAAGSLAIGLVWVYYSSMILLLGAEFTQVWATRGGEEVVPQRGSVLVHREL